MGARTQTPGVDQQPQGKDKPSQNAPLILSMRIARYGKTHKAVAVDFLDKRSGPAGLGIAQDVVPTRGDDRHLVPTRSQQTRKVVVTPPHTGLGRRGILIDDPNAARAHSLSSCGLYGEPVLSAGVSQR